MSDFTLHNHDTTMSSTSSSSTNSMTFHVSISEALYATNWTPTTKGQYAVAIIFLITLAFLYQFLVAYCSVLERRWEKTKSLRKILVATSQDTEIEYSKDEAEKTGARASMWVAKPWRWSVDLPRSALAVLVSGIGYLLMLAVMTFNVGYFLAVLGGIFAGELAWGRWIKGGEH